jgi:xanthine dehydrogenase accessory factor
MPQWRHVGHLHRARTAQAALLILGRSPVAQTLCKLAKTIGYAVSAAAPDADRETFPEADLVQTNFDLAPLKITGQTFIVVSTQGQSDEEALESALQTGSSYVAFVASRTKAGKTLDTLKEGGIPADKLSRVRAPAGLEIHASLPEEIAVSILAEIIQGTTFYFCCAGCKQTFDKQPDRYALPICR